MDFQAQLCFFLLLSFAILCLARLILLGMYVTFVTMLNRLSFLHIIGENHEFLSFFFFKFSWQFGKKIFLRQFILHAMNDETLFSDYIPPHTPPHTFQPSSDVSTSLLSMFDNISLTIFYINFCE